MNLGKNYTNYVNFLNIFLVLLSLIVAFTKPTYNWDIDHEMYYGTRLLHGELIWTHEFHDKLPFVQFLFIIPAYFKSTFVFGFISLLWVLTSSIYMKSSLYTLFEDKNTYIIDFICVIYIYLLLFFPERIYSINCIAESSYIISFFMIIKTLYLKNSKNYFFNLFLGMLFAAVAISIRPYYIASVFVTIFFSHFLSGNSYSLRKIFSSFYITVVWACVLALWGIIFNIAPYIITGNMSAFHDGLKLLTSNIDPAYIGIHKNPYHGVESFIKGTKNISSILFWFFWVIIVILVMFRYFKRKYCDNIFVLKLFIISFFSGLSCFIYILHEHYWSHYIQLFIGNFTICFVSYIFLNKLDEYIFNAKNISIIFTVLSIFMIFLIIKNVSTLNKLSLDNKSIYNKYANKEGRSTRIDWREKLFLDYLREHYKGDRPSFLFPDDMKAHWLLGESRHSFPHAAMTDQISRLGWFENISFRSSHFFIVSNLEQYCRLINEKGSTLVIISPSSPLVQCFRNSNSSYKEDARLRHGDYRINVYKKIF